MQGFMPRVRRRGDRNSWIAIEEGRTTTTASALAVPTSARLEGPPNFADPVPAQASPPPSYAQVRALSRPEIAALMARHGPHHGSAMIQTNATPRESLPPAISSSLVTLEDIRHNETHRVHLENRLSSVPNYPVFLEQPPSASRRRSQRPSSIATCSTGLYLSVGQIPGSEPFKDDASHVVLTRCGALGSHPIPSPLVSPLLPYEASVAERLTVRRINDFSDRTSKAASRVSWLVDTSANFAERWNPPAAGYYSPELETHPASEFRPAIKTSQTWPALEQRAALQKADLRRRFSKPRLGARDVDAPPPPPPKDAGYIAKRPARANRGQGAQKARSTPNLLLFPAPDHRVHTRTKSTGLCRLTSGGNNRAPQMTNSRRHFSAKESSTRPSQILSACARFMSRSVPRMAVSC